MFNYYIISKIVSVGFTKKRSRLLSNIVFLSYSRKWIRYPIKEALLIRELNICIFKRIFKKVAILVSEAYIFVWCFNMCR